jgi:hypothetical protein
VSRAYRATQSEVVSRRLDCADAPVTRPVDGSQSGRAIALLTLAEGGEDDGLHCSRAVARYLAGHGCKGWKCGYGIHAEHLAVRDLLLDVLGLGGERG